MCIITDNNHKVFSISLIPGLTEVPISWHIYFPAKCSVDDLPQEGDFYQEWSEQAVDLSKIGN